jgi:hypothetical protein
MKSANRWMHVLSVFLLLFAQHAALEHATWHQRAPSAVEHVDPDAPSLYGSACDFHGMFAQVLGAAGMSLVRILAPSPGPTLAQALPDRSVKSELPARRSRGPPVLS